MTVSVLRGNALDLPLADASVDLVVTSPPYFGLRSYQDGGAHYAGQLGSEPTPAEFVNALMAATREMVRVVKPAGSIWVNLGDKYSGAQDPRRIGIPSKSLCGIPWRFAIRCIDELGLILRAEVIWSKRNAPESVTDRVRRSHEQWFHFTREPRYFSAVDEIREPHALLGKLPGSVWTVPTQPLTVPAWLGVDHFAAFPMEWPRRLIAGWSPAGVCVACGEGRRPVVASVGLNMDRPQARRAQRLADDAELTEAHFDALLSVGVSDTGRGAATQSGTGKNTARVYALAAEARAALGGYSREYLLRRPTGLSYACACPDTAAPTTPAVVLDPFGGTATTALVAHVMGRHGISVDLSGDYCRLAAWRTSDPGQLAAAAQVEKPRVEFDGQLDLLDGGAV